MTRCRLCNSPDSSKGCTNADCARWKGPTVTGAPIPPRERYWTDDEDLNDEEVDRRVDFNREGDPAFNGAFNRW